MPRKPASEYLRTTEVIGFINSEWYKWWVKSVGVDEADRIGKESSDFGKAVHSVVEAFLLSQPEPTTIILINKDKLAYKRPLTERELVCGKLLISWCNEVKVKPLILGGKPAIECSLKSEKLKLTGHPDLVCTFGDDPTPWVVDWKTSKEFKKDYQLQLAAYSAMIKEQYGTEIHQGVIIRTPSDPNTPKQFEARPVHDLLKVHYPVFFDALNVVQYFKNKGKYKKIKGV